MNLNPEEPLSNVMKRLNLNYNPRKNYRSGNHAFKLAYHHFPPRVPYAMYVSNKKNIHPWSSSWTRTCEECCGSPPPTGCKKCCHDPCHRTDTMGCIMGLEGEQCFNFARVQLRREDYDYDYNDPSMQYWACPGCNYIRSLTEPFDGNCNCPTRSFDENVADKWEDE